jgi:hypothetical protein
MRQDFSDFPINCESSSAVRILGAVDNTHSNVLILSVNGVTEVIDFSQLYKQEGYISRPEEGGTHVTFEN